MRHLNDVRLAHPESLAAPVQRPKLGRPTTSGPSNGSKSTETETNNPQQTDFNRTDRLSSNPQRSSSQLAESKQNPSSGAGGGTSQTNNHETSIIDDRVPTTSGSEPANFQTRFPTRSTRKKNPINVDAISRVWVASAADIKALNASISSRNSS